MIQDYNKNMGGTDKFYQMLKTYYNERKGKWTYKLAIYYLNMMIHNSYIIYKHFSIDSNKLDKH